MTKSVYIIGGAGTGKSTFMGHLMDATVMVHGPLEDLHALRNAKALVTLRGHRCWSYSGVEGLYLGCLRESFPGTDGLDRASSPTGEDWLLNFPLPPFIIGEGQTLATRRFLYALHATTDLLLVYLYADIDERLRRCAVRGSDQKSSFLAGSATRSSKLVDDLLRHGAEVATVDSTDPGAVAAALTRCVEHLQVD